MDFQWFLTIPGLLISGGVLLLVIALIIFISTSNKKEPKTDKVGEESAQGANLLANNSGNTQQPITNDNLNVVVENVPQTNEIGGISAPVNPEISANTLENTPVQGVNDTTLSIDQSTPVVDSVTPVMDQPAPVVDSVAPVMDQPAPVVDSVAPVMNQPAPVVDSVAPVIDQPAPVVDSVAPVMDQPAPVVDSVAPVMDQPAPVVDSVAPVIDQPIPVLDSVASTVEQPTPVVDSLHSGVSANDNQIYGGANPTSNIDINHPTETHEIYGGANPLENTQINLKPPVAETMDVIGEPTVPVSTDVNSTNIATPEVTPVTVVPMEQENANTQTASPVIGVADTPIIPEVSQPSVIPEPTPVAPVVDISVNNK